jgi:D-sedoheptulose 7-phosphate isomerase
MIGGQAAGCAPPMGDAPPQPMPASDALERSQRQFERDLFQHRRLCGELEALRGPICAAASGMAGSLQAGGRVILLGNAVAGTIAQMVTSLLNARLRHWRSDPVALTLPHDPIALTALMRQRGLETAVTTLMAMQLADTLRAGDCVVAISTSGDSVNVVRALEQARRMGVLTVGLLGRNGGRAAQCVHHAVVVGHFETARLYEAQLMIGNTWCEQVAAIVLTAKASTL